MTNYAGNPNIAEYGKATRFGQPAGVDPNAARALATKQLQMRMAVRRIGCSPAIIDEPVTLAKVMRIFPKGRATGIDYIAGAMFVAALNGNVDAMNRLETIVDGEI